MSHVFLKNAHDMHDTNETWGRLGTKNYVIRQT